MNFCLHIEHLSIFSKHFPQATQTFTMGSILDTPSGPAAWAGPGPPGLRLVILSLRLSPTTT